MTMEKKNMVIKDFLITQYEFKQKKNKKLMFNECLYTCSW